MRNKSEGVERWSAIATSTYDEFSDITITGLDGIGIFIDNHDNTYPLVLEIDLAYEEDNIFLTANPESKIDEMLPPFRGFSIYGDLKFSSAIFDIIVRSAS